MTEEKNTKYEEKVVAFIDILGFKQLVNEGLKRAKSLDRILSDVLEGISNNDNHSFSAKLFSDCLCLSCNYSLEGIQVMLHNLAYIQVYFAVQDVFIRGGLTYDFHYENDRIIFSQGLIKAYNLEQVSNYPRVLIDEKIVNIIKNNSTENDGNCFKYILRSPDRRYFLDYLDFLWAENIDKESLMFGHKEAILKQIHANITDNNILEKYKWLADYHNYKSLVYFHRPDNPEEEYKRIMDKVFIPINREFPDFKKAIES